jgi:beta-glucosidase
MGNPSVDERVERLLAQMTLAERVGQLNQKMLGWHAYRRLPGGFELTQEFQTEVKRYGGMGALYGVFRADPWSAVTFETGVRAADSAKLANQIQRYVIEHTRLGIPVFLSEECPHGHMALDGTLLPTNIGVGSAWNPELYQRATRLVAKEVRARGAHLGLISALDCARDPRWGRTEECYSEDPYLSSRMAHAAIVGLQGESRSLIDSEGIAAVAKHFAAQGAGEGGRNAAPATIGERELREIHLPAAHAAVQAGTLAIMAAYNEIDGVPCHANPRLLSEILRAEWQFDGFVMSDGCALDNLVGMAGGQLEAAALGLTSGVDLSLWDNEFPRLEEAVQRGFVPMSALDDAVRRILRAKFLCGLFDHPYANEEAWKISVATPEIKALSRQLAEESIVLLKNEAALLPLVGTVRRIAVIGPNADSPYAQLGDYTPPQLAESGITVLEGIRRRAPSNVSVVHAKGCGIRNPSREGFADAVRAASDSDLIILVLGGTSERDFGASFGKNGAALVGGDPTEMDCGEGVDVADLELGGVQTELAKALAHTGKPIVTILIQGRPYAFDRVDELSQAVLCAWYPGPFGGQAIADLLFGAVSPSGRLPISVPHSSGQLPVFYNRKVTDSQIRYVDRKGGAKYPFGFGLSYAKITYTNLKAQPATISAEDLRKGATINVSVEIANESAIETQEVVQLYVRDREASTTPRIKQLRQFTRIRLVGGEKHVTSFELGLEDFAVWDSSMKRNLEPGGMTIEVGGHSASPALTLEIKILS